jgi:sulfur carrier protein ThiS
MITLHNRASLRLLPATLLAVLFILLSVHATHATTPPPTFTASLITSAAAAGTNDQSAATTTTQANVAQTKAALTLTVVTVPLASSTSVTIGSCVVTFATTTAGVGTPQELNCNDNAAVIRVATTSGDVTKTAAQIATDLIGLQNLVDTTNGHGALAVTASTTSTASAVFTTSGTEASSSPIKFTDGTSGKIAIAAGAASNVTGVVPVTEIDTITIGGTVEQGDVCTLHLPGSVDASYTVTSGDTTASNVATGLNAAVQASSGYAGQAFTSLASTNTVVLTAKTAGTGFTVATSTTANRAAVAQVVTFTPANVGIGYTLTATVNNAPHSYKNPTTIAELLAAINPSDGAVTCTNNGSIITCTANVAGTSFTYDASVISSGGNSGGGGGGGSSHTTAPTPSSGSIASMIADLQAKIAALIAQSGGSATGGTSAGMTFTTNLAVGATGASVHSLQVWLNGHGFPVAASGAGSAGSETMTFGSATKAALAKFQAAHGISPAAGYFGPKTRALLNSLGF